MKNTRFQGLRWSKAVKPYRIGWKTLWGFCESKIFLESSIDWNFCWGLLGWHFITQFSKNDVSKHRSSKHRRHSSRLLGTDDSIQVLLGDLSSGLPRIIDPLRLEYFFVSSKDRRSSNEKPRLQGLRWSKAIEPYWIGWKTLRGFCESKIFFISSIDGNFCWGLLWWHFIYQFSKNDISSSGHPSKYRRPSSRLLWTDDSL